MRCWDGAGGTCTANLVCAALALSVLPAAVRSQQRGQSERAVAVVSEQLSSSQQGYSTYRISIEFAADHVQDVYALYGESGVPLIVPPARQVAPPFGTDVGPTNPAFFAVMPDAEFDSFLTIGIDGPALTQGSLSSVGLDLSTWTETQGVYSEDAAVFFMDPDHGATTEPVVFLQLTAELMPNNRDKIKVPKVNDGANSLRWLPYTEAYVLWMLTFYDEERAPVRAIGGFDEPAGEHLPNPFLHLLLGVRREGILA